VLAGGFMMTRLYSSRAGAVVNTRPYLGATQLKLAASSMLPCPL
jgi:hypothetical protein